MTQLNELVTLPAPENALEVFSAAQGLDPYLAKIRAQIDAFVPDVTTRKGREAIASIAHSVARSKTALDDVGKKLVADLKDVPKKIDAERKRMRDTLDSWKDEVRKPLDDWQAAEEARVARHQARVDWLNLRANENADLSAAELDSTITAVDAVVIDATWEEFEEEAHRAKRLALESLNAQLLKRQKADAEQAELARLRAEAEARAQKDREEQIAREAAEKARTEAAQKAQAEREAVAKREREAVAAAERRELELKLQAEQAEREKLQATQRAEQAERDSEARAEAAAAAERKRQADEKAEEDRQTALREADVAHKSAVLGKAKVEVMKLGFSEPQAKLLLIAVSKGLIPNVSISF